MPIPSSRFLCLLPGILVPLLACSAAIAQIREEKPGPGLDEGVLFDKRSALTDLKVHFAPGLDRSPDPFDSSAKPPAELTPEDLLPKSDDRPLVGAGDFSIVCHFLWKPGPGGLNGGVGLGCAMDIVGQKYASWMMMLNTDRRIYFDVSAAGHAPFKMRTPPLELSTSGENQIIVSAHRDAKQPGCSIWLNGVEVVSDALPPVDLGRAVPKDLVHARTPHATHLRVYNRALTRPEILELTLRGSGVASDKSKPKHPAPPPNGPRFIPQQDETIALIGGTEAVALAESGELEALLLMAFPQTKFHFRCLAWEGDTVFRQDRPMNFGSLEQQLRRVNAGAVFVMFGRQECLDAASKNKEREYGAAYSPNSPATPNDGKTASATQPDPRSSSESGLAEFKAAFEKLLATVEKVTPNIVVIGPPPFEKKPPPLPDLSAVNKSILTYQEAMKRMAEDKSMLSAPIYDENGDSFWQVVHFPFTSNGVSLAEEGARRTAAAVGSALGFPVRINMGNEPTDGLRFLETSKSRTAAIAAKNRLWHDYWRPSNWAFLHGDRTNQPSSRDPVNPQIRLFPAEQEKYLPLIRDAEEKIYKLVQDADKKVP